MVKFPLFKKANHNFLADLPDEIMDFPNKHISLYVFKDGKKIADEKLNFDTVEAFKLADSYKDISNRILLTFSFKKSNIDLDVNHKFTKSELVKLINSGDIEHFHGNIGLDSPYITRILRKINSTTENTDGTRSFTSASREDFSNVEYYIYDNSAAIIVWVSDRDSDWKISHKGYTKIPMLIAYLPRIDRGVGIEIQ